MTWEMTRMIGMTMPMDIKTKEAIIREFHNGFNFTGKTIKRFIEEQEKQNDDSKAAENDCTEDPYLQ